MLSTIGRMMDLISETAPFSTEEKTQEKALRQAYRDSIARAHDDLHTPGAEEAIANVLGPLMPYQQDLMAESEILIKGVSG